MRELTIEELKGLQLEILTKTHDFCSKNNIRYSLTGGTLLGAIRHNGYIPWDDDIDILMPRPDYDKFINSFNGVFSELQVLSPELDWDYYASYANIFDNRTLLLEGFNSHRHHEIGVKIDVFPIDGVPNNMAEYVRLKKELNVLWLYMAAKRYNLVGAFKKNWRMGLGLTIKRLSSLHQPYSEINKKIHRIATSYSFDESDYVGDMATNPSLMKLDKKIFENYVEVDFEGKKFRSVADYNTFLIELFGDYMELPPEDKRVPHHDFVAYWKNDSKK